MKPQQPVGCEDFIKMSNAADRIQSTKNAKATKQIAFSQQKTLRQRGCIKGWDARRSLKMKPQQPVGCEDFIKMSNAADRLLGAPSSKETK